MDPKSPRRLALLSQALTTEPVGGASARVETSIKDGDASCASVSEAFLQVGDLAKRTGRTVRAIHLYEDMGLLRPVDRSKGRYRLFNQDAVERVLWISKLQTLGFSLPEIQAVLRGHENVATAKEAAQRLRGVYLEKLEEVQQRLREFHRLERELVSSLAYLDACQSACDSSAHVHSCPSCERHLDQPEPPALVAGAFAQ